MNAVEITFECYYNTTSLIDISLKNPLFGLYDRSKSVENEGKTLETDVFDDWIECSATFQLDLGLLQSFYDPYTPFIESGRMEGCDPWNMLSLGPLGFQISYFWKEKSSKFTTFGKIKVVTIL